MSVDAHVPSRAAQTLPFPVRYMLLRLGVAVLLRHTKVDDVDHVRILRTGASDQKVVRLDVTVNEVLVVDRLHTGQHLPRRHTDCLDGEFPPTHIKQVLQTRAQEINDENVVQALLAEVVYLRDTGTAGKDAI